MCSLLWKWLLLLLWDNWSVLHQKRIIIKHKIANELNRVSISRDSFTLRVRGTELWQSRKRIVVDFVIFFSSSRWTKRLIVTSRSPDWPKWNSHPIVSNLSLLFLSLSLFCRCRARLFSCTTCTKWRIRKKRIYKKIIKRFLRRKGENPTSSFRIKLCSWESCSRKVK